MQKQAPSILRLLIAAGFTLSCFGLILFLWIAFGGPMPLAPESYRITAYFPEATQLAVEADVRIGGVSVGKVKAIELAPPDVRLNGRDVAAAEIEIEPAVRADLDDARAILRQKTRRRRDLRRAHLGHRAGRRGRAAGGAVSHRRGGRPARRRGAGGRAAGGGRHASGSSRRGRRPRSTRSSTRSTRRRAGVPAVAAERRGGDPRPRPRRSTTRSATSRRSSPTPATRSTILASQEEALRGLVRDAGITFEALSERRERADRGDPGPEEHLRGARRRGRGAGRDVPDPADLPARDAGDARADGRLPGRRGSADPRHDPGRARAEPDPARRAPAGAQPARAVPRPRRPLRRLAAGPAGAARRARRARARCSSELDPFLANLNPLLRYLESRRRRSPTSSPARRSGSRARPTACPATRRRATSCARSPCSAPRRTSIWPARLPTNRGHGYVADGVLNGFAAAAERDLPQLRLQEHRLHAGRRSDPDEEEIRRGESGPRHQHRATRPTSATPPASSRATSPAAFGDGARPGDLRRPVAPGMPLEGLVGQAGALAAGTITRRPSCSTPTSIGSRSTIPR